MLLGFFSGWLFVLSSLSFGTGVFNARLVGWFLPLLIGGWDPPGIFLRCYLNKRLLLSVFKPYII